jgi:hypothetical protein
LTDGERKVVQDFAANAWRSDAMPPTEALAAARVRLLKGGPIPPAAFLGMIRVDVARLAMLDWDQACALYAGLRAAEADLAAAGRRPDVAAEFDTLTKVLYLPGHRPPGGKRFDSPKEYSPGMVGTAFEQLQNKLRAAAGS